MAHPAGTEAQDDLLSEAADSGLEELARQLQDRAIPAGISVATAESCTGGLVGHAITSIAGSSGYYLGGVISYADAVKIEQLGVPASVIEQHGAVSAQVAVAMADGARERLGADIAAAVTGIAGPDGGTTAKPVGLTYVAVSTSEGHQIQRSIWAGSRTQNKRSSAQAVLEMLIATVSSQPESAS